MGLVIGELKGLSESMIDLTGFSKDLILENDDKDDVLPSAPANPRSQVGDLYELGPHKLLVGDSTLPENYEKLMAGQMADMVFTDPPYNVNYKGRGKNTDRNIENDNMDDAAFLDFLNGMFGAVEKKVKAGGGWYIFHSSSSQDQFKQSILKIGLEIRAQLIWNKPVASMGWGDYRWKHEPFFYCGKKGVKTIFYGDRTHKTVVDFQDTEAKLLNWAKRQKKLEKEGKTTIWSMKRDNVADYLHPTQKPVELITYALANSSKEGDIILDPFLGSGSTMIASHKAKRTCYGIELDPAFADVIVQRFVDYTEMTDVIKNGKKEVWEKSSNIIRSN